MRKAIGYTFGAIALYIVVANGTNFGKAISAGAAGAATDIKALQGR